MQINELTALDLSKAIRAGEVSVREATEDALRRAHADTLGAFTHICDERALQQADQLQAQLHDESFEAGVLFGVPCPIKDLAMVAGLPMEGGSAALRGNIAIEDDGIVIRFRECGTVMIGKTATPEFGLPCYTEPEGRPPASTPFDPRRGAGGSSGGAAAAVASGVVAIAHGSDGGGSIRIPAATCGLVGLKASRGRVSKGPLGVDGAGLVSDGALTRTVRDTAAVLDALTPGWPGDPFWAPRPQGTFLAAADAEVQPLRVGVLTQPIICDHADIHRGAITAVEKTIALLEALGHHVEEAPKPFDAAAWDAFAAIWAIGSLGAPIPREAESQLRPLTRWLRERGRSFSGEQHAQALVAAQQVTRGTAALWDPFDLILTPTLAQPPAFHGSLRNDDDPAEDFAAQTRFTPWTSVYNLTGRPAITLPVHTEVVDGVELPFGAMLGGRLHEDALLISVAADLEASYR
ncbi:MAG: amidase [Propionibacteriaceae bacterium]|nr:amidase [Propionibacteriaceae bacterium]